MPKCNIRNKAWKKRTKKRRKKPKTKPSDWLKKKKTTLRHRHNETRIMNKKINGGDCGICWNAITFRGILNTKITHKDDGDMKCGPCDHLFCFKCIQEWSEKNNTCPICRQTFTRIEIFNIQTQTSVSIYRKAVSRHTSFSQPQLQLLPEANTIVLD